MFEWLLGGIALTYGGGAFLGYWRRGLEGSPYPSPDEAVAEMERLAARFPRLCRREVIGTSTEGRPIAAYRLGTGGEAKPRLLVTAHIHAIEYIGAYVARGVARRLLEEYGRARHVTELLDRADVWVVPQLNPDGATRVWRRGGWGGLGPSRFTANGVDPNRNFPFAPMAGRRNWNSGRDRPGSAYYRGPQPLSEPECRALARLCARERFCAAVNFHSFSAVVFIPFHADEAAAQPDADKARQSFAVFHDVFQAHQPHVRYKPVPERAAELRGQFDSFAFEAFGTVSVTVEVSWPRTHLLRPWNTFNFFWWANPAHPDFWEENDAGATIHALRALLDRTGGTPCRPLHPELAEALAGEESDD